MKMSENSTGGAMMTGFAKRMFFGVVVPIVITIALTTAPTVAATAWPGGPVSRSEPSCTIVFKDIDRIEEAVRALGNSEFRFYNWYLRQTNAAHDIAARNYEFAVRQFKRDNGYDVDYLQIYDANSSQSVLNTFAGNMRQWFQINRDDGSPCDLREW
jgi:hypothetical protein